MPFLIIFVGIPLLEITAFIYIGGAIGLWQTLAIALLTAISGGFIIKYQGLFTIEAVKQSVIEGRSPTKEIFTGFCLVASGALLITPGFVTDFIGFSLLIPPVRDVIRNALSKHFKLHTPQSMHSQNQTYQDPTIIEGDYERVDETNKDKRD